MTMASMFLKGVKFKHIKFCHRNLRHFTTDMTQFCTAYVSCVKDTPCNLPKVMKKHPAFNSSLRNSRPYSWQSQSVYYGCPSLVITNCDSRNVKTLNGKKSLVVSSGVAGNNMILKLGQNGCHLMQVRCKSKKKRIETDSSDSDEDGDDVLEEDDFDAPPKFKVKKILAASMRADGIVSNALDIARNRVEEEFLSSGFLVNGDKVLKKAVKLDVGDYVDLVVEKRDDQLKVKRVKIMKIYPERTSKDNLIVKVRVWKSPFFVNKSGV